MKAQRIKRRAVNPIVASAVTLALLSCGEISSVNALEVKTEA